MWRRLFARLPYLFVAAALAARIHDLFNANHPELSLPTTFYWVTAPLALALLVIGPIRDPGDIWLRVAAALSSMIVFGGRAIDTALSSRDLRLVPVFNLLTICALLSWAAKDDQ